MSEILCIGSVLWDVIGRAEGPMQAGADVPGRITRQPGGVALNIALTLRRFGLSPILLSTVGHDAEGDALLSEVAAGGLNISMVHRSEHLPTDRYMAIEDAGGLVAAIADAHSLEAAGDLILAPLEDGRIGSAEAPYRGVIALDGNLTEGLIGQIATSPLFAGADLRVAPASPGKATRLAPLLISGRSTLYVNLEEAGILCDARFETAARAAEALLARGAARALVTNGADLAADGHPDGVIAAAPPSVDVARVTGAGDSFMAAHIAAEINGASPEAALGAALDAAAAHVSGRVTP